MNGYGLLISGFSLVFDTKPNLHFYANQNIFPNSADYYLQISCNFPMIPQAQCLFVWIVHGPEWCEHFS